MIMFLICSILQKTFNENLSNLYNSIEKHDRNSHLDLDNGTLSKEGSMQQKSMSKQTMLNIHEFQEYEDKSYKKFYLHAYQ